MPENSPELDNEISEFVGIVQESEISNFWTNTPAQNKAIADIRAGTAKYCRDFKKGAIAFPHY